MTTARVPLGHSGIHVRPIGLGCMGMSQFYGPADPAESIATIHTAIDVGIDFFDTSDIYGAADAVIGQTSNGFGHNEAVLGRAVRGRRNEVVLATKFGSRPGDAGGVVMDGRPEYVAQACEASLARLGTDYIDLYYIHRLDPSVPVEETVGAMAELVTAGKIRAIGLNAVDSDTLHRASAVAPISALQSEYSLWERTLEDDVLPTCRELGITVVPYSPLGRAALTGTLTSSTSFGTGDFRATLPKFQSDNYADNARLVDELREFSTARGHTPGQVALAWLLAQPHDIVPIPGTKRVKYVRENAEATAVPLSVDDVAALADMFAPERVRGGQYGNLDLRGRQESST
ncbi:aldo/keto reductase [Streptomyces sp. 11-1-2]|uniref:aldo/keto reductase n=1 Tax=unclassified Streptomyces TaxID=2593676 RepID=UPI001F08C4E8|nr:aldo/keto reductase [Streptomyces sp. 11-1-2]